MSTVAQQLPDSCFARLDGRLVYEDRQALAEQLLASVPGKSEERLVDGFEATVAVERVG